MSTSFDAPPEHTQSWRRDSISGESLDVQSTETNSLYPQPPMAPYPSPYHGITAAAFTDINRALAVRSLRDSVRVSSRSCPPAKAAARPGSCLRSPPSFSGSPPAQQKSISIEPEIPQHASRPKQVGRARSMTAPLRAWVPLRSKRATVHPQESREDPVEVSLPPEGRESDVGGDPSLGVTRLEKETETAHPDMLLCVSRSRRRRSTVHCIIM
ncbi:hypothetical protein RhiJN_03939 [Ceratobasidium sp. AG-Ba]|nr:hypothetical protein RhiJN_03939 [Ceratobasidium sp. AG-Ba]QRW04830.1 hypothetical protein RhiLY_03829 [Ceratobasidium sp. AG-Ba]